MNTTIVKKTFQEIKKEQERVHKSSLAVMQKKFPKLFPAK